MIDGMVRHVYQPLLRPELRDGRGRWTGLDMSIRNIEPGEELTYDYNLYDGDEDDARCHCGAGIAARPCIHRKRLLGGKRWQSGKP